MKTEIQSHSTIDDLFLKAHGEILNPKYFAMLNNAVAVSDTEYEGGKPREAVAYYQYLFSLDLPNCPVTLNLSKEQTITVEGGLANLVKIIDLLDKHSKDATLSTKQRLDEVVQTIDELSRESGVCYFPSGWTNENGGHFAGLKMRRLENGCYAFSLINHGAGMGFHRELSRSGNKHKLSYQSEEYEVDLQSDNGRVLLQKIIELDYDTQTKLDTEKVINPYSEHDLYISLILHGKKLPVAEKIDEKSVTPQRTGTCPVTNTQGIVHDILIDNNSKVETHETYKRCHFVIKLRSLIAGFYAYRQNKYPRHLLEWALREFSVRLNKHLSLLNEEEIIYCGQLHQEIQECLNKDKHESIQEKCKSNPLPNFKGDAPKYDDKIFNLTNLEFIENNANKQEVNELKSIKVHDCGKIKPTDVKTLLSSTRLLSFKEIYDLFNLFPHCTSLEQDSFWDNVPQEDLLDIIEYLIKSVERLEANKKNHPLDRGRSFAIALVAYDIAAQIAPRCSEFKLENKYALGFDDVYSEQCFFTDPDVYHTVKRVAKNFEQRSINKQRILTNAVNYKRNKYDDTIHYVIRVLLNESQRQAIAHAIGKDSTDQELFEYLMANLYLQDNQCNILPNGFQELLHLSAAAHGLGNFIYLYQKNTANNVWYFTKNRFHLEIKRKKELEASLVYKHLPVMEQNPEGTNYQDFAANTIFHPWNDLKILQSLYKEYMGYSSKVALQPYQLYPSGSLKPSSTIWEVPKNQQQLYEKVNEDFRLIESNPNLQIVRVLSWAKTNLNKLSDKQIRTRINELLFQYGKLDGAFANNPESTGLVIQSFLEATLKYCHEEASNDSELLLWVTDVAYDLRYHFEVAANLYKFRLNNFAWPSYRELLLTRIKHSLDSDVRSKIASQLICSYRNSSPLSVEDCCLILVCRMIANLGEYAAISEDIWEDINEELTITLTHNQEKVIKELQHLLPIYLKEKPSKNCQFTDLQIQAIDADFTIDLTVGCLQKKDAKKIKERTAKTIAENKEFFDRLKLPDNVRLDYSAEWQLEKQLPPSKDLSDSTPSSLLKSADRKWEFVYKIDNSNSGMKFVISSVYQLLIIEETQEKFKLLNQKEIKKFFINKKNPFESSNSYNSNYQYWQSVKDNNLLFVRQENNDVAYCFSLQNLMISQLINLEPGKWERNNKLLLNLTEPHTELEIQWSKKLNPLFGVGDVRCLASCSEDKATCEIQSIEHLKLGLSFTIKDKQLMCIQVSGYFLSSQQSLIALNGLPNIVILENKEGEKKYLISAFSLNPGEKNNTFNNENIVDYNTLCNTSKPYYFYTINRDNEVIGESVEANLYLAILYRSQGDFTKAIKCLEHCKMHRNINAEIVAIAMQVLTRKIKSPLSAAFDLKLACYLQEHQTKWSKDDLGQRFKPIEIPEVWQEWVKAQLEFYKNTFSSYKDGVAIIPSDHRLTYYELTLLGNRPDYENSKEKKVKNERLVKISVAPINLATKIKLIADLKKDQKIKVNIDYNFSSLRLYDKGNNKEVALDYIIYYFDKLFSDAISKDPDRIAQFRKILFSLLQNNVEPQEQLLQLIATLLLINNYRDFFADIKLPLHSLEIIKKVGEIFESYEYSGIFQKSIPDLFEYKIPSTELFQEKSLPSDFVAVPVKFAIGQLSYDSECKQPLVNILKSYFDKTEVPVATTDFKLQLASDATLLEKYIFNHFKKGHEENKQKKKTVYSFIKTENLGALQKKLKKFQKKDLKKLSKLNNFLIKKANQTPLDYLNPSESDKVKAYNLLLARASEQKPAITLSDLFTAFLQQKPSLLTERNPFLSQQDITKLFAELADYALLQSRVDQAQDALNIITDKETIQEIEPYERQLLASILDKSRAYNAKDYPEFLFYEYASKRLLRADQVDVLIKIIKLLENGMPNDKEMRHCLLQFAAGGGKTSVLIPILAQRFARKGFLPVIINTNELYRTGVQDIPKNLQASFQQNMEVIECELEHVWDEYELRRLHQDLERWMAEGKCLLIKPVTWHAINITMKKSFSDSQNETDERKKQKAKEIFMAATNVLDFFKDKTIKLEDECQIVSDPLQQSIKTSGEQKVPQEELNLIQRYYDYLLGNEKDSQRIAELAGIISGRERSITDSELEELQQLLAKVIIKEEIFKEIDREKLYKYLLQPNRERPSWLTELHEKDSKLADLVVLIRAFLQTHLPHILSLQNNKDYGKSIHAGDLTVAPKHDKVDVSSHYGDHTLVVALTIQFYHQRGLLPEQTEELLNQLIDDHKQERLWNNNFTQPTQAEQILFQLIPNGYKFTSCRDLTAEMKTQLAQDTTFFHNSTVIKRYLRNFALPQIKSPKERYTSTAAELQAGFKRSLLLSATPGLPQTLSAFLKEENCYLEAAFEAQVIDTLLSKQNEKYFLLEKKLDPKEFFKQIPPKMLMDMTTLIDRGALFTNFKAEQIIEAYRELEQIITKTKAAASFSGENMFLKSKATDIKDDDNIKGSALVEALKKQGIKPETFCLFLFLDLSKTTGIDIKRPYDDHAGLTVGREQSVTEIIQAAMRERQLLDDNAQSVSWLMFQELYNEINQEKKSDIFDLRQVISWMIKNEAKKTETKLISRAYQGIEQAVNEKAWEHTKRFGDARYEKALKQHQEAAPYKIYELASKKEDTDKVLKEYIENLLKNFHDDTPEDRIKRTKEILEFLEDEEFIKQAQTRLEKLSKLPPDFNFYKEEMSKEAKLRIEKIIAETSALINELQNPPKAAINCEVQQEHKSETQEQKEQEKETEQRMKTRLDQASDFVFAIEEYSREEDNLKDIFDQQKQQQKQRYQALQLPKCDDIKQPELLIHPNHFAVIQSSRKEESELMQLKPITMLLVQISPANELKFLACSNAEYYSFLLNNQSSTTEDSSYALISLEGEILQTTNNTSRKYLTESLAKDNNMQKKLEQMLTYAHFLNGEISNPVILSQIIKAQGWSKKNYDTLVETIANVHVSQHPVSLLDNALLERLCGWKNEKSQDDISIETYHKNYDNSMKENPEIKAEQTLRPTKLPNNIEETEAPIIYPTSALEGYLFGQEPAPMAKSAYELRLTVLIDQTQAEFISKVSDEKKGAINKQNPRIRSILQSISSLPERMQAIQDLSAEFKEFDQLLKKLNKSLEKYTHTEPYLLKLKDQAMEAVNNTYFDFALGHSTDTCKTNLKMKFATLATQTENQYKAFHKFMPTAFFSIPQFKSTLAEILSKSVTILDNLNTTELKKKTASIEIENSDSFIKNENFRQ